MVLSWKSWCPYGDRCYSDGGFNADVGVSHVGVGYVGSVGRIGVAMPDQTEVNLFSVLKTNLIFPATALSAKETILRTPGLMTHSPLLLWMKSFRMPCAGRS